MTPAEVWAVVAARTSPAAKSRLAEVLSADERVALALRMLSAVLEACRSAGLGGTLLVTDTPAAMELGTRLGATVVADPGSGLNAAFATGIGHVPADASAVIMLPGDVPLIEPDDLRTVISEAGEAPRAAVVVPDDAQRGTNALLLRPPLLFSPSFGEPSCARHVRLAREAGAITLQLVLPRLALDVDTPAALATYQARKPDVPVF